MFLLQSVATFFSQVMAAIGGNTAGPGMPMINYVLVHDLSFLHSISSLALYCVMQGMLL